jgi:GrpB-like predicted nucleotidyltransferase (UPF0157 family)
MLGLAGAHPHRHRVEDPPGELAEVVAWVDRSALRLGRVLADPAAGVEHVGGGG